MLADIAKDKDLKMVDIREAYETSQDFSQFGDTEITEENIDQLDKTNSQKIVEESSEDDVEKKEKFVGCLQDKVESCQVKPQNGNVQGCQRKKCRI